MAHILGSLGEPDVLRARTELLGPQPELRAGLGIGAFGQLLVEALTSPPGLKPQHEPGTRRPRRCFRKDLRMRARLEQMCIRHGLPPVCNGATAPWLVECQPVLG